MCKKNDPLLSEDSLNKITAELGKINIFKQLGPGVYYLSAQRDDAASAEEYFVVLETAAIFFSVKAYGHPFPGMRAYSLHEDASGWRIVEYELCKYRIRNHLTPLEGANLHEIALYAAELHPEYFGEYPVPLHTPRGYTLRHQRLENGVYWLETSQCEELLAVCFPIWHGELSSIAQAISEQTGYDQKNGITNTMGYLFFSPQASCIAIHELMGTRRTWAGTLIDRPALMNAIWNYLPVYAVMANRLEQAGWKGYLVKLMEDFGLEADPELSMDHIISIYPDAGDKFLLFR